MMDDVKTLEIFGLAIESSNELYRDATYAARTIFIDGYMEGYEAALGRRMISDTTVLQDALTTYNNEIQRAQMNTGIGPAIAILAGCDLANAVSAYVGENKD